MARLPLLLWPNLILREKSIPLTFEDVQTEQFKEQLKALHETLIHFRGVGISAVQVGWKVRLFAMRTQTEIQTFVNPEIDSTDGEKVPMDEGCLSLPGVFDKVERYPNVIVSADALVTVTENVLRHPEDRVTEQRESNLMPDGSGDEEAQTKTSYLGPDAKVTVTYQKLERKRFDLEGIEAQCAQHEIEHLDGVMRMVDEAGPVKRDIIKRKIKKFLRERRG